MNDLRHVLDLSPFDAGNRIEIDAQLVGVIEILGADRMRMQLDAREVRHPGERGRIARHHFFRGAARRKFQRHHFDPLRPRFRRALLIEKFLADAVGVAHQHVRAAAGAAQRAFGHREVVANQVELGVARFWEQHLVRIGDRHFPAVDRQDLAFRLRHRLLVIPVRCVAWRRADRRAGTARAT